MRKRGLLLLAICAMMGVLAGCSSGNEQEVSTGQEVQTSAVTEPELENSVPVSEEAVSEGDDSGETENADCVFLCNWEYGESSRNDCGSYRR